MPEASFSGAMIRAGTSSPRLWVQLDYTAPGDTVTTYRWSTEPLADLSTYYGGFKDGRLLSISPWSRSISDQEGQYEGYEIRVTIADTDRIIRSILDGPSQKYLRNRAILTGYAIEDADARAGITPRTLFRIICTRTPTISAGFRAEFVGCDLLSVRFAVQDSTLIPKRLFSETYLPFTVDAFGGPEAREIDPGTWPEPIWYGAVRNGGVGAVRCVPVGQVTLTTGPHAGTTWLYCVVAGHACAEVEHWYYHDPDGSIRMDEDEGITILVPGRAGYIAQFGAATYQDHGGRRYTEILVRGPQAEALVGPHDYEIATSATVTIGVVTITVVAGGSDGNDYSTVFEVAGSPDADTSAVLDATIVRVTLGTDGAGDREPAKCTGALVAAAIDALDEFSAAAGRDDADVLPTENETSFTGGTETTTTVQTASLYVDLQGIEDVGDGTGTLITSPVAIARHALRNWILGDYQSGAWLASPTWAPADPTAPQLDEASWDTAEDVSTAHGAIGAGGFGANGERLSPRDAIARLMISAGLDLYPSALGSIAVSRETTTDVDDLGSLRRYRQDTDVLAASFRREEVDFANMVIERYGFDYVAGAFPSATTRTVTDDTSISNFGETRSAPDRDYYFVQDASTASINTDTFLRRYSEGLQVVPLPSHLEALTEVIGNTVLGVTDEGTGAAGWTEASPRGLRVMRMTMDLLDDSGFKGLVTLETRDTPYLLAGWIFGDDDIDTDWLTMVANGRSRYAAFADETDGRFSDGAPIKRLS